jgi:hypothetical protein
MDRNHVSLSDPWSVQLKIVGFGLAALLYQLAQLVASSTCHGNLGHRAALKPVSIVRRDGVAHRANAITRLRRKIGCQSTCRALLLEPPPRGDSLRTGY